MQPAFLGGFVFPPPAPGAEVFAQRHGARARFAADAGEELVVQRVVRHVVAGDAVPHVVPAPVGQRVELGTSCIVDVLEGHLGARARLFTAQPRHPGRAARQQTRKRFELADLAAGFAQLDALAHGQFAVRPDEADRLLGGRLPAFDRQAVATFNDGDERQCLRVQFSGVQRGQRNGHCMAGDEVGEHHVLGAQARGQHDAARMQRRSLLKAQNGLRHALLEPWRGAGVQFDRPAHGSTPLLRRSEGTVW